jgi:multidrug efflux system membrane fusion protein
MGKFEKGRWNLRAICAVAIVVFLILSMCRVRKSPMQRPPAPVVSGSVVVGDVPLYILAIGRCAAFESVAVVPQVSGQIVSVDFVQGQAVKAGDPLYTIDPRPYEENLGRADAQLMMAEAKLKADLMQFERSKALIQQNYISQQQFDAYESQVVQDDAGVGVVLTQIAQAKIDLEHCKIVSPINGIAGAYLVDVGNVVTAMSVNKPLVTIENIDKLYIEFNVSENDFYDLQKYFNESGQNLKIEISPLSSEEIRGEAFVNFIDNSINERTGSLKLRALLLNEDHRFWPGQSVRVKVLLTTLKDAVLVPEEAVKLGQQGRYVFVVNPDDSVDMRLVDSGQVHGDMVVINAGVSAGEVVVRRGQLMLAPGVKVMKMPDTRVGVFDRELERNKKIAEKNPTTK